MSEGLDLVRALDNAAPVVYTVHFNDDIIGIFLDQNEAQMAVNAWVQEWIASAHPSWYERSAGDWEEHGDVLSLSLYQRIENGISSDGIRIEATVTGMILRSPTE